MIRTVNDYAQYVYDDLATGRHYLVHPRNIPAVPEYIPATPYIVYVRQRSQNRVAAEIPRNWDFVTIPKNC